MDRQEIFNRTWHKFVTLEAPRGFDIHSGTCVYRGDGICCAVGNLIPDELYQPSMEGNGLTRLFDCFPELAEWFGRELRPFLSELQSVHDDSACNSDFHASICRGLEQFARRHGLNKPA